MHCLYIRVIEVVVITLWVFPEIGKFVWTAIGSSWRRTADGSNCVGKGRKRSTGCSLFTSSIIYFDFFRLRCTNSVLETWDKLEYLYYATTLCLGGLQCEDDDGNDDNSIFLQSPCCSNIVRNADQRSSPVFLLLYVWGNKFLSILFFPLWIRIADMFSGFPFCSGMTLRELWMEKQQWKRCGGIWSISWRYNTTTHWEQLYWCWG